MIETKDLWQSAYLLSEGAWLSKVDVQRKEGRKKVVTFILTGDGLEERAQRFKNGQAVCNVRTLKAHVSSLKQMIFGGECRQRQL